MDPFSTAFLVNIAGKLTNQILNALGRTLRETFGQGDKKYALDCCVEAGVIALTAVATTDVPEEKDLLVDIFSQFAEDGDVGKELAKLFMGIAPDIAELRYLFENSGYDPTTLPGLDFNEAMKAFMAAFLAAATQESDLQGIIQTNQLLVQTGLQQEQVSLMREMVNLVRKAQPGSLAVKERKVSATIEGKTVVYIIGPQRPEQDNNLRTAYLSRVFEKAGRLSLAGIDPKAATDSQSMLNLDAVYTALLTMTPEEHDRLHQDRLSDRKVRCLSALRMLNAHTRLVLLGDPGGGKTTFVNFVAMCLAGEAMGRPRVNLGLLTAPLPGDDGADQGERQPWEHGALLPVHIILRDFAARGLPAPGQEATADHLWRFIESQLKTSAIVEYSSHLRSELLDKGGLILLDGLDEVPEAEQRREQIKQAVEDFATTFSRCRFLVTSRTYAYQKQAWRLPAFNVAVLAPFSKGQVIRFVDHWYAHISELRGLHPDDAQGKAELLKMAIFGSERLRAFAERPLLLTLMASLHAWRGGSLPEKREELYADAVDLLLDWWERPKIVRDTQGTVVVQQPSLAEWLKIDRAKVYDLLTSLAYEAHKAQPDLMGTADIPEANLVTGLMHLSKNPNVNPVRLVEYLSQRAGLVLPRGRGVYTLPHRTFQEYLTACYLTDHNYPYNVAGLARTDPERWREVALLAGAKAARGAAAAVWLLVDALCYCEPQDHGSTEDVWGAHLAGFLLAETVDLEKLSEPDQPKLDRVRSWLVRILEHEQLPALERAKAGDTLACIGDPRFRTDAWYLPDDYLLGFVEIPSGSFLMGSDKERDEYARGDELPQHKVTLPTYYIARYPVTVVQFRAFVEESGYRPKDPNCLKGVENHPVVNVTWHEVMAYCEWLTEQLRVWKETPELLARLLRKGGG